MNRTQGNPRRFRSRLVRAALRGARSMAEKIEHDGTRLTANTVIEQGVYVNPTNGKLGQEPVSTGGD